jgi:hypothetical protein
MRSIALSKAQKRALKDLKVEPVAFGPGFDYSDKTGDALVNKGLADIIEEGVCRISDGRKNGRFLRAKINAKGAEFLRRR